MDNNETAVTDQPGELFALPDFEMAGGVRYTEIGLMQATTAVVVALINSTYTIGSGTDVADLIKTVHSTFAALESGEAEKAAPAELAPAVPVRKSVMADYIICLEDGKKFKSLKRHLRTHYGLSPEEYREKWGLPADYPMVAPSYSATRSKLAKDNGLGTKHA